MVCLDRFSVRRSCWCWPVCRSRRSTVVGTRPVAGMVVLAGLLRTEVGSPATLALQLSAARVRVLVSRLVRSPLAPLRVQHPPLEASTGVSIAGSIVHGGARFGAYGVGGNCYYYGYGCVGAYGYPWGYAGEIDPYWWWDNDSSSDQDQQYQTGLANEMNQQSLDEQRMRQQGDQDLYAQWAPPRQRSEHAELNEAAPATVLVFRDEHKQQVKNYAIVGQMLWVFDLQHTQKIPLSDLDLPATTKANDERGVDFQLPGAHEGQ